MLADGDSLYTFSMWRRIDGWSCKSPYSRQTNGRKEKQQSQCNGFKWKWWRSMREAKMCTEHIHERDEIRNEFKNKIRTNKFLHFLCVCVCATSCVQLNGTQLAHSRYMGAYQPICHGINVSNKMYTMHHVYYLHSAYIEHLVEIDYTSIKPIYMCTGL